MKEEVEKNSPDIGPQEGGKTHRENQRVLSTKEKVYTVGNLILILGIIATVAILASPIGAGLVVGALSAAALAGIIGLATALVWNLGYHLMNYLTNPNNPDERQPSSIKPNIEEDGENNLFTLNSAFNRKSANKFGRIFASGQPADSVDNSPKPSAKKLNLALVGKPEAMPAARRIFFAFAKEGGKGVVNDATNLCILKEFPFNEDVSISLFEVKSAEDIEQLMHADPALKFDAAIITCSTENWPIPTPQPYVPPIIVEIPRPFPMIIEIPSSVPTHDEKIKVFQPKYENGLAKQLNCANGTLGYLPVTKKTGSEDSHEMLEEDNRQAIYDMLTDIVETVEKRPVLAKIAKIVSSLATIT